MNKRNEQRAIEAFEKYGSKYILINWKNAKSINDRVNEGEWRTCYCINSSALRDCLDRGAEIKSNIKNYKSRSK